MKFSIFKNYPELKYGISEKSDGALRRSTPDVRKKYFEKIGISYDGFVTADLIHGKNIYVAEENDGGKLIPKTDGLVTKVKDLYLSVTVADCFPIFLYDQGSKTIGMIHAGWRGVAKNIVCEAIKYFSPSVLVGIGPGIQQCHFDLKEEVASQFDQYGETVIKDGKKFISLSRIIKKQLINSGVQNENIENSGECTYCLEDKYFSYRRDKPQEVEPMTTYIGITS